MVFIHYCYNLPVSVFQTLTIGHGSDAETAETEGDCSSADH